MSLSYAKTETLRRPPYTFKNGFDLRGEDLGGDGVKLTLAHSEESGGAILMPLLEVNNFIKWLQGRIGRPKKFEKKGET